MDLKTYYERFTSDELSMVQDKHRELHILYGMTISLKLVEASLGKVHKTAVELRGLVNAQRKKVESVVYPDALTEKLFDVNV